MQNQKNTRQMLSHSAILWTELIVASKNSFNECFFPIGVGGGVMQGNQHFCVCIFLMY